MTEHCWTGLDGRRCSRCRATLMNDGVAKMWVNSGKAWVPVSQEDCDEALATRAMDEVLSS